MGKRKALKKDKPRVSAELEGFNIQVNTFGEITSSFDLDQINKFLDKNVDDKKLKNRIEANQEEHIGDTHYFKKEDKE
jgi:hypothetical protein